MMLDDPIRGLCQKCGRDANLDEGCRCYACALICPRCHSVIFREVDCGPDTYEDDISYTSDVCVICGLWKSGWTGKWLVGVVTWTDEEHAQEFQP